MNIRTIVKKMTFFCFQQLKSNWQTGKWEKKTLSIRDKVLTRLNKRTACLSVRNGRFVPLCHFLFERNRLAERHISVF